MHGHYPKKRKTSADSGFDSDDDPEMESSFAAAAAAAAISTMNGYGRRKFKCNIRPLDAIDVIAIINGKEDSRSKVELCKCGNYHQYPKWKDVNSSHAALLTTKENCLMNYNDEVTSGISTSPSSTSLLSTSATNTSGISKYFSRSRNSSTSTLVGNIDNISKQQQKGILKPNSHSQPVEVGLDLSHGMPDNLEFTKPRRSCSHLKLRFSSQNSFAEHPDNVQVYTESSDVEEKEALAHGESLMSKLPRFLRLFL